MNILMLQDAVFVDKPGGSRVASRELARGLAARGHQITFLVARQVSGTPDDELYVDPSGIVSDAKGAGAIRIVRYSGAGNHREFVRQGRLSAERLWAQTPFDIIHTQFAYAAHGPARAFPRGAIHVRTFHGPWDAEGYVEDSARLANCHTFLTRAKMKLQRELKRFVRRRIETQSLMRSRAVVVLSDHMRDQALALGVAAARILVVHGGVDTQRFAPPAGERELARRAIGAPPNGPLLFCVRRLAPRMGLDNLIGAMRLVVDKHPDTQLLLGGGGPERAHLERLIASLGLDNHVKLAGFIPENDLVSYYAAADLFVLPTTALEGFGLVTVESLACGTPVVGTPVGATPEILGGLDARLLAPSASTDGIARGILGFLENTWREDLTPAKLHDFVKQNYSWNHHVDATEMLYQNLIEAR